MIDILTHVILISQAEGEQAKDAKIMMYPSKGELGAREEFEITVEFQLHILVSS